MMLLIAIGFWLASVSFILYGACGFLNDTTRAVLYPRQAMTLEAMMLLGAVLFLTGVAIAIATVQIVTK